MVFSNSTTRSRSCVTTASGALFTKFSLSSLPFALASSASVRAICLSRRARSAATSMSPFIGTSRRMSPRSAVAATGAWSSASRTSMRSTRPTRCSSSACLAARSRSVSPAFCNSTGSTLPGEMSISPRICRIPRINCLTHSISSTAASSAALSSGSG